MMSPIREAHTRELAQHYAYKLYGPASSDVAPEQIETATRIYMDAAEAMHDELMEERKFERGGARHGGHRNATQRSSTGRELGTRPEEVTPTGSGGRRQ